MENVFWHRPKQSNSRAPPVVCRVEQDLNNKYTKQPEGFLIAWRRHTGQVQIHAIQNRLANGTKNSSDP